MHPFDDPDVVAGQGSLGLELIEEVPDLAQVVVPVGGGGLASGIAIAVKSARPDVRVIGVQAAACAPYPESLQRGEPVPVTSALTIADGIAVKRPGELTLPLLQRWLDDLVVVGEDDTAEAMALLMERCKLVVEGAGAVGVAALLGGQVRPVAPVPRSRCSPAATSTPGCWRRSRAGTRTTPAGGWCCSRACPTARAAWPGCSRWSPTRARTSSTSRTCARGSTCTCARRRVELVLETRGHEHAETVIGQARAAPATKRACCADRARASRLPPGRGG